MQEKQYCFDLNQLKIIMAEKITSEAFRSTFKSINKELLQWFPGHMNKGLKQMQHKLRSVDCIIEVRDARIPLSGRNHDFKNTVSGIKPHLLVLNKVDLIEKKFKSVISNYLKNEYEHIIYTNCKDQNSNGLNKIFPIARDLINSSERYNRSNEENYNMMIIGVPNVGKSSLINALRVRHLGKGNAAPVGAVPGITRSVMNKIKMCEKPLFYLLDTPGILTPSVESVESGLKLGLCNIVQNHLVGEKILVDYLLFWLNNNRHFDYIKKLQLEKATDNILDVLVQICKAQNKTIRMRNHLNEYIVRPDLDYAAKYMLAMFGRGEMGKFMLDENLL